MKSNQKIADLLIVDILRGYSIIRNKDKKAFLKHFSVLEYLQLDEFEEESYEDAIKSGIKSEQQLIDNAVDLGFWSEQLEEESKSLKWLMEKHENALNKIKDRGQKILFEKSNEETKKRFEEIQQKRNNIVGFSAENLALRKRTAMLIDNSIYKDTTFQENIDEEDKEGFSLSCFVKIQDLFLRENLIRASYTNTFFESFVYQYKNPISLFNKDLCSLTLFQSKILTFANVLLNKIRNTEKIPENILSDGVKLYNFDPKDKANGENVTEGIDDLKQKMKQKGKVTSEDLLS